MGYGSAIVQVFWKMSITLITVHLTELSFGFLENEEPEKDLYCTK